MVWSYTVSMEEAMEEEMVVVKEEAMVEAKVVVTEEVMLKYLPFQ